MFSQVQRAAILPIVFWQAEKAWSGISTRKFIHRRTTVHLKRLTFTRYGLDWLGIYPVRDLDCLSKVLARWWCKFTIHSSNYYQLCQPPIEIAILLNIVLTCYAAVIALALISEAPWCYITDIGIRSLILASTFFYFPLMYIVLRYRNCSDTNCIIQQYCTSSRIHIIQIIQGSTKNSMHHN